ncbi:MAG: right-handed parallel beta-helix repeat-containing protein [Sedimentisphaerales bacterium]|nr:right-handed parallel beta-helix repeat-containing protein [Sedimentisphaerales bacterium]
MTTEVNSRFSQIIPLLLFVVILCPFAFGKVIYVDDDAVGLNDGSSWNNAYTFLQDALTDANSAEKPVEIKVAQGIYKPDQGANQTPGNRKATFKLLNETIFKGGYAGFGQTNPNARDFELYKTILNGDLSDNDVPIDDPLFLSENPRFLSDDPSRTDNCIRVVTATNASSNTMLEGVVITGAYFYYPEDNGYSGAGLYIGSHANITVSKCVFTSNAATGMLCLGSDPIVMDCSFNDNIGAPKGGGIYIYSGNPRVIQCTFKDNWAGDGGGLYGNGGRLWLENCIFIHNVASGLRYADVGFGGGICCDYSYEPGSKIINCIFIDNVASSGGAAHFGLIGMAPPISRKDERILLTGCTFIHNRASFGGALHQRLSTLDIQNSVFNKNLALRIGGAISTSLSITNLEHCIFSGNSAFDSGASIYATGSETSSVRGDPLLLDFILTLKNCTFRCNSAPIGRTLHCMSHNSEDVDTTIISNCIIDNGGNEIYNPDGSQTTIDYTNLLGGASSIDDPCNAVVWGTGNINENPLFVDQGYWDAKGTPEDPNDDSWVEGDYHLKSQAGRWDPKSESWIVDNVTSPCIDAGDPNSPIGHEPFPNGGIINMGAYGGTIEASKSLTGLHAKYGGGKGEPNNPYLIYTAEHLNTIRTEQDWDKNFKLMADIDLDPNLPGHKVFDEAIIGNFKGFFDGNGHRIMHLTIEGDGGLGLFSLLLSEAEVRDLEVVDVNIAGRSFIGGLVGINGGHLVNCFASGTINGTVEEIGGLVGQNYGIVEKCHSTGTMSGKSFVGGLVGENLGYMMVCYSTSDVSGDSRIGGLVGANGTTSAIRGGPGMISDCYSTGQVSAVDGIVGGLVGSNEEGTVTNCYSTGLVVGNEDIGGLVGLNKDIVLQCFWDIQTSNQTISAGGIGKTSAEMQMADTFLIWSTCGNEGTWTIDEGNDYPKLFWENKTGETIAVGTSLPELLTGEGLKENPYLIYTGEELNYVGLFPCDWDKHYKLMADIDLSDFDGRDCRPVFNIIGSGKKSRAGVPFTGIFDGDGHTIANFTYILEVDAESILKENVENVGLFRKNIENIGLFGCIADANAQIKNVGMIGPIIDVATEWNVGCLAGCLREGCITDCYVEGGSVKGENNVGGLVGYNDRGSIRTCHSTNMDIEADGLAGGLIGTNYYGSITKSYSIGNITARVSCAGGLVGYNEGGNVSTCHSNSVVNGEEHVGGLVGLSAWSSINLSYSTSIVTGNHCVGGLVGYNDRGSITTCYSSNMVTGNEDVGGLVGDEYRGSITSSYSTGMVTGNYFVGGLVGSEYKSSSITNFWDIETSGQTTSASGTGKTTAEMQMASTFLEAGWDFVGETDNGTEDIWRINEGQDYPRLWWETE